MGLFAGLNVLPKTAWFSSYSGRVDSAMNLSFLMELHKVWCNEGLLSDTTNLDFTTITYLGESEPFVAEEERCRKRYRAILHGQHRVEASGLKKRTFKVWEQHVTLSGYKDEKNGEAKLIRQIAITGHSKIKPAVIITYNFDLTIEFVIRKYCKRWLVEKGIFEQIDFFHLNRVSSSMVIKVDFDLVMSILAYNLYRLYASYPDRYQYLT